MENAGLREFGESTGIFMGFMGSEYLDAAQQSQQRGQAANAMSLLGSSASIVAGRISHFLNCKGPAITVDTACSSSLVALDLACQAIRAGRCRRAIVGGVSLILSERGLRQRVLGKMLAYDGVSRSFGADASGYGRADGCVVMLLEEVDGSFYHEAVIEMVSISISLINTPIGC